LKSMYQMIGEWLNSNENRQVISKHRSSFWCFGQTATLSLFRNYEKEAESFEKEQKVSASLN
jgi:hypothetical protein